MTGDGDVFEVLGVRCARSEENRLTFVYLPGDPRPESDPAGRPTLNLFSYGARATLQLGSRWDVPAETLEAVRARIAEREKVEPGAIVLSPARVEVEAVTLEMGDGRGGFEPLARVEGSGFPPFQAIFSVPLEGKERDGVAAALAGRIGWLGVRYRASATVDVESEVEISGDVAEDLPSLYRGTAEQARQLVRKGIAAGRLKVARSDTGEVPEELARHAIELAEGRAAEGLLAMAARPPLPGTAQLQAGAAARGRVGIHLERFTDVGTWFPGRSGPDHITVLPGTTASPS